jgi:hypothetical protein
MDRERISHADVTMLTQAYPLNSGEAAALLRAAGGDGTIAYEAYKRAEATVRVVPGETVLSIARLRTATEIAQQRAAALVGQS